LKKIDLFGEVGHQFGIEFLWIAPCLIQSRLSKRQSFDVVLLRLIELSQTVIGIELLGELFAQLLAEPFSFIPLPGADYVIGLVAQPIKIIYFAAVKEGKHMVFVQDSEGLEKFFRAIKSMGCPFCEHVGALNRHSLMHGNDPEAKEGRITRGQRVFCSDRGRRGGCGRTFPILFTWALPQHSLSATLVWQAVHKWLGGMSIRAAWQTTNTPLALDSFYHYLQRLRRRLTTLRTLLSTASRPPDSMRWDPLLQTFEHLETVFPKASCPVASFQQRFQTPLTG